MKKKNVILIIGVIVVVLMLIPIPKALDNIGSVEYNAVLYKYTKVCYYSNLSSTGYIDRWELKILGIRVGGNVNTYEKKEQKTIGSIILEVKEDERKSTGATFIIKNTTDDEYSYGEPYAIEKFQNGIWEELDTLTGAPLSWNAVLYEIKAGEEKELYIDWSLGYGELKNGTYRLVKHDLRKSNSPESRTYTVYAEFDIK